VAHTQAGGRLKKGDRMGVLMDYFGDYGIQPKTAGPVISRIWPQRLCASTTTNMPTYSLHKMR